MRPLSITEAPQIVMALHDEIRRTEDARYDHRLHTILLVTQGMSCREAGKLLGDAPRTVENWVHQFEERGFAGLTDQPRPGRPPQLSEEQLAEINSALRSTPETHGIAGHLWDGRTLSEFIRQQFSIDIGIRQCQRLFRKLGFRYRKPRPMIACSDPKRQEAYKKSP